MTDDARPEEIGQDGMESEGMGPAADGVPVSTARARSPHRVLELSDGVFAVALTLLTFDLVAASKLPEGETGLLGHLLREWPTPMAYMVGFLTILVCWINHRYVFTFVQRVDSGLLWLNGLQLALVAAVPLPTSILAENIAGSEATSALLIYGVTFFLMAASFLVLSSYILGRDLSFPGVDIPFLRGLRTCYALATAWTVLCLAVASFTMYPALIMWALMFLVFAFPRESAAFFQRRSGRSTTV